MSDYLRLAMIMPYILHRFLKVSSLKVNDLNTIKERTKALRVDLVPKSIISCWVHVAKTMKAVFSSEFTVDDYEELEKCLREELIILPKVITNFENLGFNNNFFINTCDIITGLCRF